MKRVREQELQLPFSARYNVGLIDVVNNILTVNKMTGLLDQLQEIADAVRPLIEKLSGVLTCGERHQACRPVDLGPHILVHNHVAEVLLGLVLIQRQQLCEPVHRDVRVIARNSTDVLHTQVSMVVKKMNND